METKNSTMNAGAIAKFAHGTTQKDKTCNANTTTNIGNYLSNAKTKLASHAVEAKATLKKIGTAVLAWTDKLPGRLSRGLLRALIIAIVLNVIARFFWPELPETIPTIYGFFNGFLTVGEFLYKTALGGIASIFNGTFFEFSNTMMAEIGEMWSAFCTWISAITF